MTARGVACAVKWSFLNPRRKNYCLRSCTHDYLPRDFSKDEYHDIFKRSTQEEKLLFGVSFSLMGSFHNLPSWYFAYPWTIFVLIPHSGSKVTSRLLQQSDGVVYGQSLIHSARPCKDRMAGIVDIKLVWNVFIFLNVTVMRLLRHMIHPRFTLRSLLIIIQAYQFIYRCIRTNLVIDIFEFTERCTFYLFDTSLQSICLLIDQYLWIVGFKVFDSVATVYGEISYNNMLIFIKKIDSLHMSATY